MAAGQRVVLSDGTRGVISTGDAAVLNASDECDECCGGCTASGTTCTHCSAGDTPTGYTVLFSLVNLCTACHLNAGTGQNIKPSWVGADVLNTSHIISQVGGSPCRWKKTIANAVHVDFYTESDGVTCGTFDFDVTNDLVIQLDKTGSDQWKLEVTAGGGFIIYTDTFTGDGAGECETVPASSNSLAGAGNCGNAIAGGDQEGYGGSATITCQ